VGDPTPQKTNVNDLQPDPVTLALEKAFDPAASQTDASAPESETTTLEIKPE
jgi:hypothetical protein